MQLGRVHVIGVGRLSDASMKVRGKVTAVVGPNEAGKSTLLRALASVSNSAPFTDAPGGDVPRRRRVGEDDIALQVFFALDADDQEAIAGIANETTPTHLVAAKLYGGRVTYKFEPVPRRLRAPRRLAAEAIDSILGELKELDDEISDESREQADQLIALAEAAHAPLVAEADPPTLGEDALTALERLRGALTATSLDLLHVRPATESIEKALEAERLPRPSAALMRALSSRIPVFAMFGDEDRNLAYEYDLENMTAENVPPALHNLAVSGNLDIPALLEDIEAGRRDATAEHIDNASDTLRELFNSVWTAGSGTAAVHLTLDGTTLSVMVDSELGRYSPITDRSEGLRMFVALTTFVRAHTSDARPVVLLIDEAENHLHYDAQADLMGVLTRQEVASQVVYTTHSAGCLPDEMGGNIVAVVPDRNSGYSSLDSSYWTSGFGFSPLMMAMGAGAAAITPSRYAVLAEGQSEALILPRLLREATGLPRLGYQVAAGVAEVGRADVPHLDAEAGNVAYLVDGDVGGTRNAKKLIDEGIPENRVIHLGGKGSGICLEQLIKPEMYTKATEVARAGLKREPSKADIAAYLIDVEEDLLSPDQLELVADLHGKLSDALQIPAARRPRLTSR